MPYVLSKLANTQIYTNYAKGTSANVNIEAATVEVKGGADVTDKNLVTPEGVLTRITDNDLDILKSNKGFQKHLEGGYVKYFGQKPDIEKHASKMTKDKSKQLTKSDYKNAGRKAPKTEEV